MVKKKKQQVVIKTDKKGRYITIKGRKYYLKPKEGISERELIKFIIKRFHRRRRKGVKKEKENKQRSYPVPSAADSWASGSTPIEKSQAYSKAVLNNKLAQIEQATKQLSMIEGQSAPLALPSAVEDALIGYEAKGKKAEEGSKRIFIKGKAYDLPEEVYDELGKGVQMLMKKHEEAKKKAEEEEKKAEEAQKKKNEALEKAKKAQEKLINERKNLAAKKAKEMLKRDARIAEQAREELKARSSSLTADELEEIGKSLDIVRSRRINKKVISKSKGEMFDEIYKKAPNKLIPYIEKQIEIIKKREGIKDDKPIQDEAIQEDENVEEPIDTDWGRAWDAPPKQEELPKENKKDNNSPEVHVHIHNPAATISNEVTKPEQETEKPEKPLSDAELFFSLPFHVQDGSGNNTDKGVDTEQIDKIMMKYSPVYVGTIPRDYIKKLVPIARKQKEIAAVVNLDNSDQKGSHWISLYINAKPGGSQTVEVFDSFGRQTPRDIVKDIKLLVDAMNLNTYLKFKENRVPVQSAKSSNCGYFSMRFLIDRFRGKSFSEASGYSECKPNVVSKNEKEIERLKKQAPFSYI